MSWARPVLNLSLSWFERPWLARGAAPDKLRRAFAFKSKLWFHAPRGTKFTADGLEGIPALWVRPKQCDDDYVILYFHGGGYFMGAPQTHQAMLGQLAKLTRMPAVLPDYRKAPENPFPAAYDDAIAAYKALLARGFNGTQIVIGGDSAGGGLALALLAGIGREGLPQPAMTFAFSPFADLTISADSHRENNATEVMLPPEKMPQTAKAYLQGADPRDPRASPLYASFNGAGPVYLYASHAEILRDDTVNMAARLKRDGVEVTTRMEAGLPHVWPLFHNLLPEARVTLSQLAGHIRVRLFARNES